MTDTLSVLFIAMCSMLRIVPSHNMTNKYVLTHTEGRRERGREKGGKKQGSI